MMSRVLLSAALAWCGACGSATPRSGGQGGYAPATPAPRPARSSAWTPARTPAARARRHRPDAGADGGGIPEPYRSDPLYCEGPADCVSCLGEDAVCCGGAESATASTPTTARPRTAARTPARSDSDLRRPQVPLPRLRGACLGAPAAEVRLELDELDYIVGMDVRPRLVNDTGGPPTAIRAAASSWSGRRTVAPGWSTTTPPACATSPPPPRARPVRERRLPAPGRPRGAYRFTLRIGFDCEPGAPFARSAAGSAQALASPVFHTWYAP